ncbi:MAG: DNA alkylation repair protein [Anaerolineae bacterium]|jgi:3-methyladenine DNA glycosylase AlkD|nr:DNA alkylation repair protein [Anaerolineae bacterium]
MRVYADAIREFLRSSGSPDHQPPPGYTGSPHLHHGVSVPVMRDYVKAWIKANPDFTRDHWIGLLDLLYTGESIEERLIAGLLIAELPALRRDLPLDQLHTWLGALTGWVEIDTTCQSTFTANELITRWDAWCPFLAQLAKDPAISRRRASLVLLIKPIRESSESRLITLALQNVDQLHSERNPLIQKAISWILREGTKRHSEAIRAYLETHEDALGKTIAREVRHKLDTGKKK